eukprot:TRINITY_DN3702_c0_g2_i12.p1 TRINITY_DN3702_c0_g2~~TRINITY_DN3702_c0_g2_i12.p1  ORF type:complete len:260 (-),score=15.57 TRINITY_DN3702_c0_g2_i12:1094-1873(-)
MHACDTKRHHACARVMDMEAGNAPSDEAKLALLRRVHAELAHAGFPAKSTRIALDARRSSELTKLRRSDIVRRADGTFALGLRDTKTGRSQRQAVVLDDEVGVRVVELLLVDGYRDNTFRLCGSPPALRKEQIMRLDDMYLAYAKAFSAVDDRGRRPCGVKQGARLHREAIKDFRTVLRTYKRAKLALLAVCTAQITVRNTCWIRFLLQIADMPLDSSLNDIRTAARAPGDAAEHDLDRILVGVQGLYPQRTRSSCLRS